MLSNRIAVGRFPVVFHSQKILSIWPGWYHHFMRAGTLDRKIEIQRRSGARSVWITIATVRARKLDKRAKDVIRDSSERIEFDAVFEIRWRADLSAIAGSRIAWTEPKSGLKRYFSVVGNPREVARRVKFEILAKEII